MNNMEESNDRTSSVLSGGMNNKMTSDSGYGSTSNKSNSQSQRSSGSSKSHQSSLSSGSRSFLSHPPAPAPSTEQHGQAAAPVQVSTAGATSMSRSEKDHKRKKKSKGKTASITNFTENNQRLPSTATEGSQELFKKLPGPSETPSNVSVGNRAYSGGEFSQQASPDGKPSTSPDTKALQMAALTHALSCIKKFRDQDMEINDDSEEEKVCTHSMWNEYFDSMKDELSITENYFGAVVSMEDGLVIHITKELTQILGYPKDMWMGRSFMDLVHPKDKMAFASQFTLTGGITFPTGDLLLGQKGPRQNPESFFCRLRQYRGLKTTGFGVVDKTVVFFPFRVTLKLKEIEGKQKSKSSKASKSSQSEVESENSDKKSVYLFIVANRISSAYQYPEEVPLNPDKFVTRHSASCQFGHIDSVAVKYLGHLPQDVVGNSVLDYYHPDDLILLKDIYEGVMAEHGKPFKSKPYRFRVYNGTFAILETDWSCFINPWSWKLEFVIGQHKVLKGPLNPNVFMPPKPPEGGQVEDGGSEGKLVQDQIKQVLAETVTHRVSDPIKQRSSRRKKDLVVLLEVLLDQIGNNETSDLSDSVGSGTFSVLERDSAMLGEISPHHDDHSTSNQSSETPPSYNQLNYRENIERFFLSQPKTSRESDESVDAVKNDGTDLPSGSTDEDSKESPIGSSGSGNRQSGSNSEDNNEGCEPMNEEVMNNKQCSLTEDVLYRHNENMEKYMVQQHRESRGKNNSLTSPSHINSRCRHSVGEKINLKRTGNLAGWASTGSSRKAHKQPHMDLPSEFRSVNQPPQQSVHPVNLWPPYSVGLTQPSATATFTNNSFETPVPVSMPGIAIPAFQYLPAGANPPSMVERQQPNSFVCFPNQLRQYIPPPVSYAIPGAGNVMYHSLGTPSFYGQPPQLFGHSLASQQIMMGSGGSSVLPGGSILHPGHVLPTVPGSIQPLGLGPGAGIGVGIGVRASIPVRPNFGAVVPNGMNQMLLNTIPGLPQVQLAHISGSVTSSASASSNYPTISTSTAPSVSASTSSGISVPISASSISPTAIKVGNNGLYKAPVKASCLASSERVAKDNVMLAAKRNLELKEKEFDFRDFSSSDGFGSSSSCSLYSLPKNGRSSDDCSNSPCVSQEGKDFSDSLKFQSNSDADGDQDMIWENHAEKKGKEQGILKSISDGRQYSALGKAKLNKKPPWLQNVDITKELNFRYQIPLADLSEVLQNDLNKLKIFGNQPSLVDEQLGELYKELELDGLASQLNLEEGSSIYSSSRHSEESADEDSKKDPEKGEVDTCEKEHKDFRIKTKTRSEYDKVVQVYEENCPFPNFEVIAKLEN